MSSSPIARSDVSPLRVRRVLGAPKAWRTEGPARRDALLGWRVTYQQAGKMAQVRVTVNGRSYRLECDDASRARFEDIAEYVAATVDGVIDEFGQIGHDQVLLLAALKLADELFDAQDPQDARPKTDSASGDDEVPAEPGADRAAQ